MKKMEGGGPLHPGTRGVKDEIVNSSLGGILKISHGTRKENFFVNSSLITIVRVIAQFFL